MPTLVCADSVVADERGEAYLDCLTFKASAPPIGLCVGRTIDWAVEAEARLGGAGIASETAGTTETLPFTSRVDPRRGQWPISSLNRTVRTDGAFLVQL